MRSASEQSRLEQCPSEEQKYRVCRLLFLPGSGKIAVQEIPGKDFDTLEEARAACVRICLTTNSIMADLVIIQKYKSEEEQHV